jgi:hypothetical protein
LVSELSYSRQIGSEIDVWQGLNIFDAFDLGYELEEQAEFADFDGLFHDVHAVEVVHDDDLRMK